MPPGSEELRAIYEGTAILRRPTYGIVSGYHEVPYVCLGASHETNRATVRVKGTIFVSPQFVIRPRDYMTKYRDLFGEDAEVPGLAGRVFGFLGFPNHPMECSIEGLNVRHYEAPIDRVLAESLDELDRHEDITTGVIITPDSRYYPVSVERFIASILKDEFRF